MRTMRAWRGLVVLAAGGLMVAVTASPALAKGPDQLTITGPGLARPIVVGGVGEPGSMDRLGELTNDCALFTAMFGPDPSSGQQFAAQAPTTALGPKYTLAWGCPPARRTRPRSTRTSTRGPRTVHWSIRRPGRPASPAP